EYMSTRSLHSPFRTMPAFFLAFLALAGLMLCLTAMHSAPINVNMAPETAIALTAHHELSSAQSSGTVGAVATCQGPCGQDHVMMAATCAIALLVPLLLMGAARVTATSGPFAHRMPNLSLRAGAVAPLMPPSLLA